MSTTKNHLAEVKRILSDLLYVDESEVVPERSLTELGADSLDDVEIMLALENDYNIHIPDDEVTFKTVADIVTYLEGRGL